MKFLGTRVIVAVWLAFMFATVGPALFGDLLILTAPVTCPDGEIRVQTDVYKPHPGETVINRTPLCTSASGTVSEVPGLLSMVILWVYAMLPSLLLLLLIPSGAFGFLSNRSGSTARASRASGEDRETLARLNELKQAHASGLITQEEYDQKRKEIVKGM